MTSWPLFNLVRLTLLLLTLPLAGCATESPDECTCKAKPTFLTSGNFRIDGATTTRRDATFPAAGGTDHELTIDAANGTARLTYMKAGKRITETWRKKKQL
jgi:YD repeat-containing protein